MSNEYVAAPREAFTMPPAHAKFSAPAVRNIIQTVCEEMVGQERPYIHDETQPLIKELCSEIQQRVVRLGYERYKMVAQATIAEAGNQGLRVGSRCLWDPETDNYASHTYSTEFMHVTVSVFGVYWE